MPESTHNCAVLRPAKTVFDSLEGLWTLHRTMSNGATMKGTAVFKRTGPSSFRYREEGFVTLSSDLPVSAFKEYNYRLVGDEILVELIEEADAAMHRLKISQPWPVAVSDGYVCGCDFYAGEYRFNSPNGLEIVMNVRGPRKDYRIQTVLLREVAATSEMC